MKGSETGFPLFWSIWRAGRSRPARVQALQRKRLEALVAFARRRSRFYGELYADLPETGWQAADLPPVSKKKLNLHFDDWVTDPSVTRAEVERFTACLEQAGAPFQEKYAVHASSGTTGFPAIFLHDRQALSIASALVVTRGWGGWQRGVRRLDFLRPDFKIALIVATEGHFAGFSAAKQLQQSLATLGGRVAIYSVLTPQADLVRELNAFQPTILISYPTVLLWLEEPFLNGRLAIRPWFCVTSAEWLAPEQRQRLVQSFGCPLHDFYGSSEFMPIALSCSQGTLHLNADWCLLEPVDRDYRPVPPDVYSHTVLLTNLVNRVQPLIRYDLGDSVSLLAHRCACGSPLPGIAVHGRTDEILIFSGQSGERVAILPRALVALGETAAGVERYQFIQTGRSRLAVRLEARPGSDRALIWSHFEARLRCFLEEQGIGLIELTLAAEPPGRDRRSEKFRQVFAESPLFWAENQK